MTEAIEFPHRRFQIWMYTVGHAQLLLRSTKEAGHPSRVDVLFKNVGFIQMPAVLDGLVISESTSEDATVHRLPRDADTLRGRRIFQVRAGGSCGYVIAGVVMFHEDEAEYFEPSHFAPSLFPREA